MHETLVARTYSEGYRPLGTPGQRNHAVITNAVASRCSPVHAFLFPEPLPTGDGSTVDWFAPIDGPVRQFDELSEGDREKTRILIAGPILQLRIYTSGR